jgi:hypothetical protein
VFLILSFVQFLACLQTSSTNRSQLLDSSFEALRLHLTIRTGVFTLVCSFFGRSAFSNRCCLTRTLQIHSSIVSEPLGCQRRPGNALHGRSSGEHQDFHCTVDGSRWVAPIARTDSSMLIWTGRLAPTLLEDLALYDPAQPGKPNLLRDNTLGEQVPRDGCRHEFWLKPRQSVLPALDERPAENTRWRVAAICCKCRVHLTLDIDYSIRWQPSPCPNDVHHLHHFIHSGWREKLTRSYWEQEHPARSSDISVFECSSDTCSAIINVCFTPPEIEDELIETLVNKDRLKERTEAAFQIHQGNTQGMKQPLPIDVLKDLRVYVKNAWDKDPSHRTIKLSNKRFVVRFGPNGEACKDVLVFLGFRLDEVCHPFACFVKDCVTTDLVCSPGRTWADYCNSLRSAGLSLNQI